MQNNQENHNIGENIRLYRIRAGLTIKELSKRIVFAITEESVAKHALIPALSYLIDAFGSTPRTRRRPNMTISLQLSNLLWSRLNYIALKLYSLRKGGI